MKKVIFGFVGQMGSGKGTAAKYLAEKHDAKTYKFSTILRDILGRLYLPTSRDNMVKTSEMVRATFGEETLARVIAEDVGTIDSPLIMIDGIRRTADCAYLLKLPEFVLVEVTADIDVRLQRIQARGENPDDATLTMEQFKANHERSTEKSIAEIAEKATEHIDNNGDAAELEAQIDALVQKYQ